MTGLQWVNLALALGILAFSVWAYIYRREAAPGVTPYGRQTLMTIIVLLATIGVFATAAPAFGGDVFRFINAGLRMIVLLTLAGYVFYRLGHR